MNTLSEMISRLLKASLRKMGLFPMEQHDEAEEATASDIEVVKEVLRTNHDDTEKAFDTISEHKTWRF